MHYDRKLFLPFILTAAVIAADQITKLIILNTVELNTIGAELIGDFLRIIHVRNTGIAFSIGDSIQPVLRSVLFIVLPSIVLVMLVVYYLRSDEFTGFQRWVVAGVIGGGIGNIIDRIFRPEGVVDFIDVKFYGLFGLERFPTFNIADSTVVVCGILLFISLIVPRRGQTTLEDPPNE